MEIIHKLKRSEKQRYLLKLDFERAYDMVDWKCLLESIERIDFGQ